MEVASALRCCKSLTTRLFVQQRIQPIIKEASEMSPFMAVVTSRFPSRFSNTESVSKLIMITVCSSPDSNSQDANSIYSLCDSYKWTNSYSMINLVRLLSHKFCPCTSLCKHPSALCSVALHRPLRTDVMIRSGPIEWIRVAGRWLYLDPRLI